MPRLVIRKGVAPGRDHALGGECTVGRHQSATFVLDDQLVSRQHFRVVSQGGVWILEDLGSTNGTLVNGQRTTRQPLIDGDVIQAGSTQLVFVQKDILGGTGEQAGDASAPKAAPTATPKFLKSPTPKRRRRR